MNVSKTLKSSWIGWMQVASIVLALSAPAFAAEPGAIELKATAEKVVVHTDENGAERTERVKPELVVPGDRIEYTIAARNVSEETVEQVVITDPIPSEMLFVPGTESSEGARVLFSVDGGQAFGEAGALEVAGDDGVPRPATAADFTHIQWIFDTPLAPSTERSVRFVALVE